VRARRDRATGFSGRTLRRKDLIAKIPQSPRYQLTSLGRRGAVLFTKAYGRLLAPGLAVLDPHLNETIGRHSTLAMEWRRFERALDDFIEGGLIAT